VLALGNPTIASGPFHDAFTANRSAWATFTISAFDTPNLDGVVLDDLLAFSDADLDVAPWPSLVTRRWVREKYQEWGPTHPFWAARVLGEFPTQAPDSLIALSWLEAAGEREAQDTGGPVSAGLDVAGPGEDETVLAIVEGPNVLAITAWADADARGAIVAALAPYRDRLTEVNVDTIGIGYNLALHLGDLGYPVRSVNVAERANDSERYRNRKAELLWDLRQRFEAGAVAGLIDETTIGQLAGLRYRHDPRGRVEIESKDEASRRGVRSPDRAEAVMLAFAGSPFEAAVRARSPLPPERRLSPYSEQLRTELLGDDLPDPFAPAVDPESLSCGECDHFQRGGDFGRCLLRRFEVRARELACPEFDARIGPR
jgi:hypothetical protein